MFKYDDQFDTAQGLIRHYIKLCEYYGLKYTHEAGEALPADLKELRTIITSAMEKASFTEQDHLYQIMWFAKIPDQKILYTLLDGLLEVLTKPLQQPYILQAYVFACQQSDKALLKTLWLGKLLKPMEDLIEACAEIIAQDNISCLNTALTELNLLFDEMVKRGVKLADQYKKQLKQLPTTTKEIVKHGKQEKFYELSDKITYAKMALNSIPSYLTREEKWELAFETIAVVGNALELVAAGLALPVTFGLSGIIFIKDVALLAKQVRELSKAYPSFTKTTEWYGFVQEVRQLIALNVLTEKQVPGITDEEITQLWVNFEDRLFNAIGENSEKIHFNISLLPALVHVVESLSNLILLGNRAESLALSVCSQKKIVGILTSIFFMSKKKRSLGPLKSPINTNKEPIANLKDRIRIYLQTFAKLPAKDHVISKKNVRELAVSVPKNKQLIDQVTMLLNRFKMGQDSLLFTSNLVHRAWEQSLSCSFVYSKLLLYSRKEIAKAMPTGQSAIKQEELYIKPNCRELNGEHSDSYDLRARFDTFLASTNNQRVLWVLGDPGSGKTLAALQITEQLLDEYQPGKYLPVLITLPNVSEPMRCLRIRFNEILLGHGEYLRVMDKIRTDRNQPLVFIFEAYDEVFMNESFDVYSGTDEQSNHLEEWPNIKVLITVRANYKSDERSFKELLQHCPSDQQAIVYLEPLQESQIRWYLERFLTVSEEKKPKRSRLDSLMSKIMQPAIRTLVQNPLFLSFLVKDLALLDEKMTQFIRLSLYNCLLKQWFTRAKGKLKKDKTVTPDVIEAFVEELAFRMFKQETVAAPDLTHPTKFLKFWNGRDPAIRELFDIPFEKLLHGSPLKRVMELPEVQTLQGGDGQTRQWQDQHKGYKFIHDTFRTYYLAKYFFKQLIKPNFDVANDISTDDCITSSKGTGVMQTLNSDEVVDFLVELIQYGISREKLTDKMYTLDDCITSSKGTGVMQTLNSDEVVDFLVELIQYGISGEKLTDKMYTLLERNNVHYNALCLSVLTRGGFRPFYRENLSGLDMSHAKLRGGVFQYTNFSGSTLDHVDLGGTYVGGANFNGASLEGATISIKTSACYPIKVVIDDEKRWLVSYDSNNELAMRELATGKLVGTRASRDNIMDIALVNKTHNIAVLTSRGGSKRRKLNFYQLSEKNELVVAQEPQDLSSKATALISLPDSEALCWSRRNELVYYNLTNRAKFVHKVASSSKVTVKKIAFHWERLVWLLSDNKVAVFEKKQLTVDQSQEIKAILCLNKNRDYIRDIAICTRGQTQLRVLMAKEQKIIIANIQLDEKERKVVVVGQSLQRIESTAMYSTFCGFDYVIWACDHGFESIAEQRRRTNMFFRRLNIDFATKYDYNHDSDSIALLGHADTVTDMKSYEVRGKQTLISAGEDGVIHRWELDTANNSWKLIWRSGIRLHARGCEIEGAKLSEENGDRLKALGARGQYERLLDVQVANNAPAPNVLPLPQPVNPPDIAVTPDQPVEIEFDY